jgi:hypothetical protein
MEISTQEMAAARMPVEDSFPQTVETLAFLGSIPAIANERFAPHRVLDRTSGLPEHSFMCRLLIVGCLSSTPD